MPGPVAPTPVSVPRTLSKRQTIVTQTVDQSSASPSAGSSGNQNKGFPVAVAVPALIGGMLIAILGSLGWWWWSRKKAKERREVWERKQRRARNKAALASKNPSAAPSRNPSEAGTGPAPAAIVLARRNGSESKEKDGVPPVPTLDKEAGYGYGQHAQSPYTYGQPGPYGYQPVAHPGAAARQIDYSASRGQTSPASPISPTARQYADQYIQAIAEDDEDQDEDEKDKDPYGDHHEVDLNDEGKGTGAQTGGEGKKSSRSTKRVEAADSAAARDQADPNVRWKPSKPSPLAGAGEQDAQHSYGQRALSPSHGTTGYGYGAAYGTNNNTNTSGYADDHLDAGAQETLAPIQTTGLIVSHDQPYGYANTERASGQWSTDPNVQANTNNTGGISPRGASGQYSTDPYAGYHPGSDRSKWV